MEIKRFISVLSVLIGLTALLGVEEARAADDDEQIESYSEGPTVRRKLLYRSGRMELQPMLGMTAGDSYLRNGVGGLNFSYYLTNAIGLGLTAGYSFLHPETSLAKNVKITLANQGDETLDELDFSYLQWFAGLEFNYVPIFGKFSVMNSLIANYDFHLMAGVTMVGRNACSASNPQQACAKNGGSGTSEMKGVRPAMTLGAGFRMFLGDAYAVNFQVRDHLYRRAEVSTNEVNPKFANNLMVTMGFSLFFPQAVKISK